MPQSKSSFTIAWLLNYAFTKAAYAKQIDKSQSWVDQLIKQGKVVEVKFNGGSFVYQNPKAD